MKLWHYQLIVLGTVWIVVALFTGWLIGGVAGIFVFSIINSFIKRYYYSQHPEEDPRKQLEDKGKALKAKFERGGKLTPDETKYLKDYLGPVWYATLKKKKG